MKLGVHIHIVHNYILYITIGIFNVCSFVWYNTKNRRHGEICDFAKKKTAMQQVMEYCLVLL